MKIVLNTFACTQSLEQLETQVILFPVQMQKMDFLPLDTTVPQEKDPLDVMLNFSSLANVQSNMNKVYGFDSIADRGLKHSKTKTQKT